PEGTKVELDANVQLSGAIAQFGRTGLVHETAKILIGDFSRELEARLEQKNLSAAEASTPSSPNQTAGGLSITWRAFVAWVKGLFVRP
ncbi:MAG: hypothetical protein AAFY56_21545, partial [Pseudomonadota bacterium]